MNTKLMTCPFNGKELAQNECKNREYYKVYYEGEEVRKAEKFDERGYKAGHSEYHITNSANGDSTIIELIYDKYGKLETLVKEDYFNEGKFSKKETYSLELIKAQSGG